MIGEQIMKSKKIVAGILAAAITVSSIAPEAFASIIGTDSNGNYCVNVFDLIDNDTDISDVYGATVKFTDESAEVLSIGAGGGFVFNTCRGWDQLQWCTGCGENETHDIFWNTETNSITRLDTSPICTEDDIVMRSAEIALSQWWGDNISIKSISLLDKDGNELTSKDMPDNPVPGDASGGIEEPDEPYPGESSGYVPEPGEDENDYTYNVLDDGTIEITRYNGNEENVVVPAKIDGKKVTQIGNRAFEDNTTLINVTIPNSVTYISDWVFSHCTNLKNITIPDSVVSVGVWTFYNCSSLTNITIPNSVTSIGDYAFSNCTNLKNVTISDSVTSIGDYAFIWCTSLTGIDIGAENDDYVSVNGILFNNDKTELIYYPAGKTDDSYSVLDGVTSIANGAFYNCDNLTNITIPDSVTNIGNCVFSWCTNLKSITIPDNVTSINFGAFYNCNNLASVTIPDSVTEIDSEAFSLCTSLTSITIPNNVTSIGDNAFDGCTSLTSIVIPNGVTSIDDSAFSSCTSLTSVTIPDSVISIGNSAFSDCTSLNNIKIPISVTSIGSYALGYYYDGYYNEIENYNKIDNFKIYCYAGTAGEQYAKDNGFEYELLECKEHKFGDWIITKAATYTATGIKTKTCPDCGKVETATIAKLTLAKIGGFKAKAKDSTNITLQWNKNNEASGYIIEVYNGKTWSQVTKVTSNNTLTYKVTKLSASKTYQYKIKAYKTEGKATAYSDYSATLSVNTNPSGMSGFKVKSKTATSVTLQWNKNTSATGYEIQKWDGKKWVAQAKIVKNSVTTYTPKNLKASTTYKYKIRAYKTIGKATQYSGYVELSVNTNPTNMSGFKAKSKSYNSITLQWNKNTSATGYELQKWDGKKWVALTKISKNSTTTYTVKSLKASTTYKYKIRAYKTIGKTTQYSAYSATLSVNTNPSNISGFKVKAKSYNSITLQWNKNTSATGYELQKWDGKKWVTLTKIAKNSTTTYTVKGLKASTTYKYRIRAYKTIGKATQYSAYTTTLSVNTNPYNMSGFKAKSKSYNSVTLQWKKNTSATGYELQKWDGKKWVTLTKIAKNSTTTYTVKSLKASTTYKYRIRAYKTIGKATQYSAYTATLSVNTNPTNMSGFKAKSTAKTSVTLQWNKNTSATGYEIQKWNGKKWVSAAKVTKNSTVTSTVKSLKANTSYKFRIRAYKTIGKTTQYSSWSGTLTVKTKK